RPPHEESSMRTLIAEDNPTTRLLLETTLGEWGYQVVATCDGKAAWQRLQEDLTLKLVLLDWKMPEMDGIEICQEVRRHPQTRSLYIILLTSRAGRDDMLAGLAAGADDYITKPFDPAELRARLQTGARIVDLQQRLADRVQELENALARV